jgi:hypothetical protein
MLVRHRPMPPTRLYWNRVRGINIFPPKTYHCLALYPAFNIYPLPFFNNDGSVQSNSHSYSHYANQSLDRHAGLLQPSSGFRHHGCVSPFLPFCNIVLTLRALDLDLAVLKFRNCASHVHQDLMDSELCGASVNNAVPSRWSRPTK